jgi:hypothetical protein
MEFLHIANTRDILKRLDEVEQSRRILPIFGAEATGKTRLVQYWLTEYPAKERGITTELRPGLSVDLWEPVSETIRRSTYVTPITNVLFSETLYQMGAIPSSYQRQIQTSRWCQPTGTLSTDKQFVSLFNCVRNYFKKLHIRIMIIDNAQLLDECALRQLMRLRKERKPTCGMVLCIRLVKNEKFLDALERFRKKLPEENRRDLMSPDPVELQRLTLKEFRDVVLKTGIFEELGITFSPPPTPEDLEEQKRIGKRSWEFVGKGDWMSIENLHDRFRIALRKQNGCPRTLTPEILRDVFGDW